MQEPPAATHFWSVVSQQPEEQTPPQHGSPGPPQATHIPPEHAVFAPVQELPPQHGSEAFPQAVQVPLAHTSLAAMHALPEPTHLPVVSQQPLCAQVFPVQQDSVAAPQWTQEPTPLPTQMSVESHCWFAQQGCPVAPQVPPSPASVVIASEASSVPASEASSGASIPVSAGGGADSIGASPRVTSRTASATTSGALASKGPSKTL